MTINETMEDGKCLLAVQGNVDTNTAPQLQTKILQAFQKAKDIEIDMAECPYMSSAGLRALLIGEKTAKSKGGSMTLLHVQDTVMKVFVVSNFQKILTIREEA